MYAEREIIELTSSSEEPPRTLPPPHSHTHNSRPPKSRQKEKTKRKEPVGDVIEITDSEPDSDSEFDFDLGFGFAEGEREGKKRKIGTGAGAGNGLHVNVNPAGPNTSTGTYSNAVAGPSKLPTRTTKKIPRRSLSHRPQRRGRGRESSEGSIEWVFDSPARPAPAPAPPGSGSSSGSGLRSGLGFDFGSASASASGSGPTAFPVYVKDDDGDIDLHPQEPHDQQRQPPLTPTPTPLTQPHTLNPNPPLQPPTHPIQPPNTTAHPNPNPEPDPEPDPEPQPETIEPPDPIDTRTKALAAILEIIPDVDPEHASTLIEQYIEQYQDQVSQPVLHVLLEGEYPKVQRKAKGKRKSDVFNGEGGDEGDEERGNKRVKRVDYASLERVSGGKVYGDLALQQLQVDFPRIPKPYLRARLQAHKGLYAPTWLDMKEMERANQNDGVPLEYTTKTIPYAPPKGKGKELHDDEFEEELKWVQALEAKEKLQRDKELAEKVAEEEYERTGDGIECGCCFSTYPFNKITQCPETHLFCKDCITRHVETKLGDMNPVITCIDQSGCKAPLPDSELRSFLPEKLWDLYERLRAQKAVEDANLEGLTECPFCDWKCVIDLPFEQERLLRCGNEEGGCGVVSCRQCKKPDHRPKSCKEAEEDKVLDGQHSVEEAMTKALMRNCPKCKKAFIKTEGCNKMTCPYCHTLSCYVCRQEVKNYDHFNQVPGVNRPGASRSNKCPLYDQVEQRHADEVKAAAEKALAELKAKRPDINENDIKVDIPTAPRPAVPVPPGLPRGAHFAQGPIFNNMALNVPPGVQAPIHGGWGNFGAVPRLPPPPPVDPPNVARLRFMHQRNAERALAQQRQQQQQQQIQEMQFMPPLLPMPAAQPRLPMGPMHMMQHAQPMQPIHMQHFGAGPPAPAARNGLFGGQVQPPPPPPNPFAPAEDLVDRLFGNGVGHQLQVQQPARNALFGGQVQPAPPPPQRYPAANAIQQAARNALLGRQIQVAPPPPQPYAPATGMAQQVVRNAIAGRQMQAAQPPPQPNPIYPPPLYARPQSRR